MLKSKNKVVLITGGSDGIGAACVNLFAAQGWAVVNFSFTPGKKPGSENYISITGDVCDAAARQNAVSQTIGRFGRIDILVNNAAVGLYSKASETDIQLTRKIFDINFFAMVELTQLVAAHMKQNNSGTIVNIGSIGGYAALPWAPFYCASKFAVHAFSDSLRRELGRNNIHVAKICPGIVDTDFRKHVLAGDAPGNVSRVKSLVSPEKVAAAVLKSIIKKKSQISVPLAAKLFIKLEQFCPRIMDWYLAKKW